MATKAKTIDNQLYTIEQLAVTLGQNSVALQQNISGFPSDLPIPHAARVLRVRDLFSFDTLRKHYWANHQHEARPNASEVWKYFVSNVEKSATTEEFRAVRDKAISMLPGKRSLEDLLSLEEIGNIVGEPKIFTEMNIRISRVLRDNFNWTLLYKLDQFGG